MKEATVILNVKKVKEWAQYEERPFGDMLDILIDEALCKRCEFPGNEDEPIKSSELYE